MLSTGERNSTPLAKQCQIHYGTFTERPLPRHIARRACCSAPSAAISNRSACRLETNVSRSELAPRPRCNRRKFTHQQTNAREERATKRASRGRQFCRDLAGSSVRRNFAQLAQALDRPFALPNVVLAQLLLVFGDLLLEFGKRSFRAAERIACHTGSVHRSGWKREVQRKVVFGFMRTFFEAFVQTDKFGVVPFQDSIQFIRVAVGLMLDRDSEFLIDVIVRNFHSGPLLG